MVTKNNSELFSEMQTALYSKFSNQVSVQLPVH